MSVDVSNNKRRRRRAMAKNAKRSIDEKTTFMRHLLNLFVRNSFSRDEFPHKSSQFYVVVEIVKK